MKKIIFLTIICFLYSPIYALTDQDYKDIILETAVIGTFFIEYRQNLYAITSKTKYYNITIDNEPYILKEEITHFPQNPFLGRHPSKEKITSYFIVTSIWHISMSYILPNPYRNLFQCSTLFFESTILLKNYKIQGGWHIKF